MTLRQFAFASAAIAALALSATQASAQAAPTSAPLLLTGAVPAGVCSFNFNRAVVESTAGKYMVGRLNEIGAVVRAELEAEQTKLQSDAQAVNAQKATLTQAQLQSQGEALQARDAALQRKAQIRQREMEDTKGAAEHVIVQQLGPIVQQTALARRCTLLLSVESLVLPNPSIDITDSVMASLNLKLTQFPIEREHLDQGATGAR